jgi:hypothetical protein
MPESIETFVYQLQLAVATTVHAGNGPYARRQLLHYEPGESKPGPGRRLTKVFIDSRVLVAKPEPSPLSIRADSVIRWGPRGTEQRVLALEVCQSEVISRATEKLNTPAVDGPNDSYHGSGFERARGN